jgi:dihydrofolate reductase
MSKRKLILSISVSLNGFIAASENDLSWFSIVEKEGKDYEYTAFNESVDTYVIGREKPTMWYFNSPEVSFRKRSNIPAIYLPGKPVKVRME